MTFFEKFRLPAILCSLALLVCALVARPFAETGIIDDWSFILELRSRWPRPGMLFTTAGAR